jgi:raffinose/stachyose/melibiose transport system substrate-binding protein
MKKRNAFVLFLLIIMILSACSNSKEAKNQNAGGKSSGKPAEKAELTWITFPPGDEEQRKIRQEQIIDPFEAMYPNIKLRIVENNEPDMMMQQQLAAGAGPDIVVADGPVNIMQYANAGYLLPMEDYAKKYKWNERFYGWAYDTGFYKGKLYGLPSEFETLVVFYNKDLFKEKGWNTPTNYEEMKKLNESIQKDGIMPFSFGTTDFRAANDWWLALAYNNYLGAPEFKKVLKNEVPWTSDMVKEATKSYVEMWQKGYINDKQSHAISRDDAWTLFYTKKSAMQMSGTWDLSRLTSSPPPFDVGFFIMPAWREGVSPTLPMGLGSALGINKQSKHPDEAAAFLDFYFSKKKIAEEVKVGKFEPVNDLDIKNTDGINPLIVNVRKELDEAFEKGNAGYTAWTYFSPTVRQAIWENIDAVFLKQMTIDEYLQKIEDNAKKSEQNGTLFNFKN